MSSVHFIGGEKGGVGKSVLARLLAQYWIDTERPWQGFDSDRSHGALVRYYQGYAEPVEISELEDLDRMVEAAAEGDREVLVDLAAQTERDLHHWVESGGVLDLANELGLKTVFWHVMDDGKDSVQLLELLLDRYGDRADYVVVLNQGRGDDFSLFLESEVRGTAEEMGVPVMQMKALHRPTMRKIDKLDKSFWAAIHNREPEESLGLMERQRVKVWLQHSYDEFERLGV